MSTQQARTFEDRPRVGFLGVGWIGRNRLDAISRAGAVEVAAVADPSPEAAAAAAEIAPGAEVAASFDDLLDAGLDGLVIATPSAMHAEQAIRALDRRIAVFCQKPLGRTATEARCVVDAARAADRLLGVDLSYRHVAGAEAIREQIASGALGRVFSANLVFHNAYGPDKPWFYNRAQSGGGCVIDLGVHLVDLALWMLGHPRVVRTDAARFASGERLASGDPTCEDFAVARIDLDSGATLALSCSWRLNAGYDAEIRAEFFGTAGGAAIRNAGGSFYDFTTERSHGTSRELVAKDAGAWGAGAATAWACALAEGGRFDPEVERVVDVAAALDEINAQ